MPSGTRSRPDGNQPPLGVVEIGELGDPEDDQHVDLILGAAKHLLPFGEGVGQIHPVVGDSEQFLETVDTMKGRLVKIVERFGAERVLYAGPECGLKGYPTIEIAFECLRRAASVVKSFKKQS